MNNVEENLRSIKGHGDGKMYISMLLRFLAKVLRYPKKRCVPSQTLCSLAKKSQKVLQGNAIFFCEGMQANAKFLGGTQSFCERTHIFPLTMFL